MTVTTLESPYRGLRPFEDSDDDALLFFGREHETEVIAANLQAARLTVLYGPSGVGKSSVLRAGVMHRLRSDGDVVVRFESWSGDPVEGIAEAVRGAVSERLGFEVEDEGGPLAERLEAWTGLVGTELYLVLDQVEEYFLYHGRNGRPDALLHELPDVVNAPGLRVNVLLGIREDALAALDAFKARIPQVLGNYLRLDRLDRSAGEAAILGPLAAWSELTGEEVAAEPTLVEGLLDEVSVEDGRIEAPYLQVVLQRVWDAERAAGSSLLRRSTLVRLGGAERIVDEHLERALAGLDQPARDTAAAMFAHLVTPGGTKIAHELRDLASYAGTDVRPVASALVRERILRPVDGGANGGRVEIYHDVLAGAVAEWRRRHETERRLERERRRHRRLAATVAVLVLGLIAMTGLALYAFAQRGEARERARSAAARELTAHSLAQLTVDPEVSVLLALEAASMERTVQVEDALRTALVESRVRSSLRARPPVAALAYTHRGELAVVDDAWRRRMGATTPPAVSEDAGVRAFGRGSALVVARDGRERSFPRPAPPHLVALSGDGRVAATADRSGRVVVQRPSGPVAFRMEAKPAALALDRSGRHVTVAAGRSVRTWDVATRRGARRIVDRATITAAALSPDGTLLATGSTDGAARIWNRVSGHLVGALANHGHHVTGVTFSRDGTRLLTTSRDGLARTWRTEDGHQFAVLRGHTAPITAAAFDAEAGRVVTAAEDGRIRIWDSGAADELEPVMSGTVPFLDAVSGRSGRIVGADERGVRVDGRRIVRAPARLEVAALSRDGRFAVGATGRSVTVWRTDDGSRVAEFRARTRVTSAAVSAARVVWGGADGVARVRSIGGGGSILLRGHTGGVTAVGLSPDGTRVATGDGAGVVRLWRDTGGPPEHVLRGHQDLVSGVSFSADGGSLATASRDRDARTWDVRSGRHLRTLVGHFAIVSEASFSGDGRWVVTAGPVTAGLWLRGAAPPSYLRGHSDRVMSATFAPDAVTVVTASRDGTVRMYRCEICRNLDGLVRVARERLDRTGRTFTAPERRRLLAGD